MRWTRQPSEYGLRERAVWPGTKAAVGWVTARPLDVGLVEL